MKLIGIPVANFNANIRQLIEKQEPPEAVFASKRRQTNERESGTYGQRQLYDYIKRPSVAVIAGVALVDDVCEYRYADWEHEEDKPWQSRLPWVGLVGEDPWEGCGFECVDDPVDWLWLWLLFGDWYVMRVMIMIIHGMEEFGRNRVLWGRRWRGDVNYIPLFEMILKWPLCLANWLYNIPWL